VRVHSKPFVRWVWLGGLLMALGGVMAALDARYRRLAVKDARRESRGGGVGAARPAGATA
jgi:Cytochrome c biogenesis factor